MSTDELSTQARDDLRRRAQGLCDLLNQVADLQEEIKTLKTEAKGLGYDMKAFAQIVKELRRGSDYQAAQLELELVVDTYRRAAGLPCTLEDAQEAVRDDASSVPGDDDIGSDDVKIRRTGPRTFEASEVRP